MAGPKMRRRRFWIESIGACVTALVTVLTLLSREWLAVIFHVDPDRHSGALEVTLVVASAAATLALAGAARRDWQRLRAGPARS
jgi:hypothetical protein